MSGENSDQPRPNVLVVMSDQHNARIMGCSGDPLVATPHMDRLAQEGVRLGNAYCSFPLCCPSRMSFLTGRYASEIDCLNNWAQLSSDIPTFAHAFSASGYETVLCGRMHIVGPDQRHGFQRRPLGDYTGTAYLYAGWNRRLLEPLVDAMGGSRRGIIKSGPGKSSLQTYDERVCATTVEWLRERGRKRKTGSEDSARPFLVVAGFYFPHNPWVAPPDDFYHYYDRMNAEDLPDPRIETLHAVDHRRREMHGWDRKGAKAIPVDAQVRTRAAYYGMCTFTDRMLGRILGALTQADLAKDTIVVYVSDHGELLGHHGMWSKSSFYEESAAVPLIIRLPGSRPGDRVVRHAVSVMDLGPTLLDLTGSCPLPHANGRSFAPLLRNPSPSRSDFPDEAFAENFGFTPARMVRTGPWKYCYYEGMEAQLFNLEQDPGEFENRAHDPDFRSICASLEARVLEGWDIERARRFLQRRKDELPLLQAWAAARIPDEPDPPWFDGPQQNYLDAVETKPGRWRTNRK